MKLTATRVLYAPPAGVEDVEVPGGPARKARQEKP